MEYGTIWKIGKPANDDDDSNADARVQLCQAFNVVGRASNLAGDADAGVIIEFVNENGNKVEKTIYKRDLIVSTGKGVLDILADAGMTIYTRKPRDKDALLNLLTVLKTTRHIRTTPRPGWVRDEGGNIIGFMPPTGNYIEAGSPAPFRLSTDAMMADKKTAGTLEGWQVCAEAGLSHVGNFYWGFGVCSAFAGPLLGLAGMPACGAHFSGASSLGKSLAILLGGAAWGTTASKKGVVYKMNTTTNASEDLASIGSESFLGLDETSMMENPKLLDTMLFSLAEGAPKSRKKGSGAGLVAGVDYLPCILMCGERSLKTLIENAGGDYKTGISVRFPDISVSAGKKVSAEEIAVMENVTRNYGHAGPAFVRWLIAEGWHKRGTELRKRIDDAAHKLSSGGTAAQGRAAKVFALVQIAGQLAIEAGILPEHQKGRVVDCVKDAWTAFMASDEGRATDAESSLLDDFRAWCIANTGRQLTDTTGEDEPDAKTTQERRGWVTKTQIVLLTAKLDMKAMNLKGSRDDLFKALGLALKQSGKNNTHTKLPAACGGGVASNVRLDRNELGIPYEYTADADGEAVSIAA